MVERYLLIYQEYFTWIVANAFHGDKILPNYRPPHIQLPFEKETGRKNIKALLKHSINMRNFLNRDKKQTEDYLVEINTLLSDSAIRSFENMNCYIFSTLFDSNFQPKEPPTVKGLEIALQHLKKNFKS